VQKKEFSVFDLEAVTAERRKINHGEGLRFDGENAHHSQPRSALHRNGDEFRVTIAAHESNCKTHFSGRLNQSWDVE
jgi:hypothetical protein